MLTTRQSVILPDNVTQEIQRLYQSIYRHMRGSMQVTLARGAELALEELRQIATGTGMEVPPTQSKENVYSESDKMPPCVTKVLQVIASGDQALISAMEHTISAFAATAKADAKLRAATIPGAESPAVGVPTAELVRRAGESTDRLRQARGGDTPGVAAPPRATQKGIRHKRGA